MRFLWLLAFAAALHAADTRPVVACFGDSLTAGFGLDPGESYPADLQRELDRRGFHYRVMNLGVSGETSQDGVEMLPRVLALKPAIVVLEFGGNDGLRGQPLSHTQADLAKMIEAFQKARTRVVLAGLTLPPNYGGEYIRRFDAMYKGLAARFHVAYIPFILAGVAGNPNLMQRDGIHPNAAGTKIVARTVMKALPLKR
jgi:acyl-CoA thioesterase I